MKTRHLLWAIAALTTMLLTACSNNDDNVSQSATSLTPLRISASYDTGLASKTSYAESGATISATWDAGDQLYVVYNGKVNTLSLTEGAGTTTATFEGSIIGTPTNNSVLICYVKDANNPSVVTVSNTGEYTYQSGTFLSQDGTLEGAAKCNLYYGTTTYGSGEDISCTFSTNTSMMKFTVYAPDDVNAGDEATLTYNSGDTEISKATFTVGESGRNTIYLTIPAGTYTGAQTLTYKSGENEGIETLSATKATFKAGETYSKTINYATTLQLQKIKDRVNAGESYSEYIGQYVASNGVVSKSATNAIGIIAYISNSDVDTGLTGTRILVLSNVDVNPEVAWGVVGTEVGTGNSGYNNTRKIVELNDDSYGAAISAWNYNVATPGNKQWFLPSETQWRNILESLGNNNTATLISKAGLAEGHPANCVYWASNERNATYPASITLYSNGSIVAAGSALIFWWGKDNAWRVRATFAY